MEGKRPTAQRQAAIQQPISRDNIDEGFRAVVAQHLWNLAFRSEGRIFALLADPQSILRRMDATTIWLAPSERDWLVGHICGAIVEVGADDPPMVFGDPNSLRNAWLELRQLFHVPLEPGEGACFGLSWDHDEE